MNNTAEVTAGKPKIGGAINVAPTNTTLPTDATTALAAGFTNLGYVSDDGLKQNITRDIEKIKAWGGDTIMTSQTEFGEEFTFTLLQPLNVYVRKVAYGDANVSGTLANGITTLVNSKELPAKAWAIELLFNGAVSRIVIPNGKVTEVGEISYVDDDTVGYEVTITALPDSSGNCSYEYTKAAS